MSHDRRPTRPMRERGFTLVEMLITAVLLAGFQLL